MTASSSRCGRQKCLGLLSHRERWGLSLRGWGVLLVVCFTLTTTAVLNVQPFLATTQRTNSKILVVEGWIDDFAIRAAVKEFQEQHYDRIYTTGGPVVGSGGYINDFNTSASVGAELLVHQGVPRELVQMVPSHISSRARTYSAAVALRDYFQTNNLAVKSFNVLTQDVHARRTRMLFQMAFGKDVMVGIVSAHDPDYDPAHWWRYSEGVREIIGESIAYLYAALFFHPPPPPT